MIGFFLPLLLGVLSCLLFLLVKFWPSKKMLQEVRLKNSLKTVSGLKQTPARSWVVLTIDMGLSDSWNVDDNYTLTLKGPMRTLHLKMQNILNLPFSQWHVDWVCVTGWTRHGLDLIGVPIAVLFEMVGKDSFCRQVSADGYETSVFTEDLDGAFLCFAMIDENGKKIALPRDHGGIRLVCPSLFGWKSAKFLVEMEFRVDNCAGFWEKLACHPRGRISFDERWAEGNGSKIWPFLIAMHRMWGSLGLYFFTMSLGAKILGLFVLLGLVKKR